MAISQRRMTLQEFLRLPEEKPALELIDGRVTQKVSPTLPHGWIQLKLATRINDHAQPRRLGLAIPELRVAFAESSPVPDIAVLRWNRLTTDESGALSYEVPAAPDVAIEIRSPGQTVQRQLARCRWLVSSGVQLAYLVDPLEHLVYRVEPDASIDELPADGALTFGDVIPGLSIPIAELFGWLRLESAD